MDALSCTATDRKLSSPSPRMPTTGQRNASTQDRSARVSAARLAGGRAGDGGARRDVPRDDRAGEDARTRADLHPAQDRDAVPELSALADQDRRGPQALEPDGHLD